MIRNSITLFQYAGYLLVIGLASAIYNAATGEAGWNRHGASGLYACGGSAVVATVLGYLAGKGKELAAWTGLALSFMLLSYGGYKFFSLLRDVDHNAIELLLERAKGGEILTEQAARSTILYKAGIFGTLFVFSMGTFLRLGTSLRRGKSA